MTNLKSKPNMQYKYEFSHNFLRTVEVYDSFRPKRLLEVRFERAETSERIRSCRTSYSSIRSLYPDLQEIDNIAKHLGEGI